MYVDICLLVCCLFFFFKQKTAYEMRISDWSSDVCSSDLHDLPLLRARFGVSMEQLAHRLTSLGRTGARGVPFFMAKVDRAGIVSKRFDGEAWPFARLGGTCPRWDAHEEQAPDAVAAQLIETMDGRRFVSLTVGLPREGGARGRSEIGRAHVCTPVTNAPHVCSLLLEKNKKE